MSRKLRCCCLMFALLVPAAVSGWWQPTPNNLWQWQLGALPAGNDQTHLYAGAITLSNTRLEAPAMLFLRNPEIHPQAGFLAVSGSTFRARQ